MDHVSLPGVSPHNGSIIHMVRHPHLLEHSPVPLLSTRPRCCLLSHMYNHPCAPWFSPAVLPHCSRSLSCRKCTRQASSTCPACLRGLADDRPRGKRGTRRRADMYPPAKAAASWPHPLSLHLSHRCQPHRTMQVYHKRQSYHNRLPLVPSAASTVYTLFTLTPCRRYQYALPL